MSRGAIFSNEVKVNRFTRSAILGALLASSAAVPALAQSVVNADFETGTTSGWTANGGIWQGGWPIDPNNFTGAPTLVSVQSAGTDAITGAQLVFSGNNSVKLNNSGGGRDVSVIRQTVLGYDDGLGTTAGSATSLYFAWNAVLQPSHGPTDSPNFSIIVQDLTTNSAALNISYSAYSAQGALDAGGNPLFRTAGGFVTSDWRVENVSVIQGHDYELIFLAADCDAGGHGGYVYLDGFGSVIPTANQNVGFDPAVSITQGANLVGSGSSTPDIVTPSGNSVSGLGTVTTRRFNGGTLTASDDSGNFTIATAGGVIDAAGASSTFSGTFANDASDIGKLTIKNTGAVGQGKVALTGTNTHSGGTEVLAGAVLEIQSASALGTGALSLLGTPTVAAALRVVGNTTITNNVFVAGDPLVDVASGVTTTISGVIADDATGPGDIEKIGAGTLVLSGQNTYTGGTIVTGGTLSAGAANTLPVGQAVSVGASGTLDLAGYNQSISTLSGAGSTTLGSAALTLSNANGTYAGVISGAGSLRVTGGTEILTGANTYTGGTTIASGATLRVGNGGTTGAIVGNVANSGALVMNRSDNVAFAGNITGTGSLTKTGAGALTLSGVNTYSGGTTVTAGSLIGNTTALQGAIVNNAAVEFAQTAAGTYAGAMTGSGQFTKSGAGALTLSGVSSITGVANVTAGTLAVNGTFGTGGMTVRSGATLGGSGSIGGNVSLESGATLAPGNSPGTLSVVGNVTLAAGSTFVPEIDGRTYSAAGGSGSFDRLALSGTASIGGTVAPVLRGITGAASNTFTPVIGDAFTVITAGNVTGSFAGVTQPTSGLAYNTRFDAIYRPTTATLVITPASYGVLGLTNNWIVNATNAGFGIDQVRPAAGTRTGGQQGLFDALYGLNSEQLRRAVTQLSGEAYAHALQSQIRTEGTVIAEVIDASCEMGCNADAITTSDALWLRYVGDYANQTGDLLSSGYRNRSNGVVGGVTMVNTGQFKFGLAASYSEDTVNSDLGGKSNIQSGGGYLYLHYLATENLSFSGALGVTLANTQTTREIDTSLGRVIASSKRKSSSLLVAAQASYRTMGTGLVTLWTDLGVELGNTSVGRISETATNADFALVMSRVNKASGHTSLGGRLQLATGKFQAALTAGWLYQIADHPSVVRGVELGNARWTVSGVNLSRSGMRLGAQAGAQLSDRISLFGSFKYTEQGSGYKYTQASGGVRIAL